MIEVNIKDVFFDVLGGSGVVLLTDLEKNKVLPIWIGLFEAQAIQIKMKEVKLQRPLTHDLTKDIIQQLGASLEKVEVHDLVGNTYYARLLLKTKKGQMVIDSRPSDALALAVRFQTKIYLAQKLYTNAQPTQDFEASLREEFYKKYLESLSDDELKKA